MNKIIIVIHDGKKNNKSSFKLCSCGLDFWIGFFHLVVTLCLMNLLDLVGFIKCTACGVQMKVILIHFSEMFED